MSDISDTIGKKKFLMELIALGQHEADVDVMDTKFRFRALDDEETTGAQKESSGFDIVTKVLVNRKAILSRAIVSIVFPKDGGSWVPASRAEASILFGKFAPVLVETLINKYDEISMYRNMLIEQALGADKSSKEPEIKN